MAKNQRAYSTGEVAKLYPPVAPWQVARLFERGLVPERQRLGRYRIITEDDLPEIERALREAGYLVTAGTPVGAA